jgi:hypothetical protein
LIIDYITKEDMNSTIQIKQFGIKTSTLSRKEEGLQSVITNDGKNHSLAHLEEETKELIA